MAGIRHHTRTLEKARRGVHFYRRARDLEVDVKPPEPRGVRPNSPQRDR